MLCDHNEKGSFGFVLNRFVDLKIQEIIDDFPEIPMRVSVGGPVKNSNLFYLHTLPDLEGSEQVFEGIYMGGDFDLIKSKLEDGIITKNEIRFFVGYSGWTENQLENELNGKSWYVIPPRKNLIMNTDSDSLWSEALKDLGGKYAVMANFPEDPSLN